MKALMRSKSKESFPRSTRAKAISCTPASRVTDRRNAEEALDRVRSELAHVAKVNSLGAMAALTAHEINRPLCGIVTNASTCVRMPSADSPNLHRSRQESPHERMLRKSLQARAAKPSIDVGARK
jgi:C4-dicarboxylate-specific signal transduction histidine kinase